MPDWIKRKDEDLRSQSASFSQAIGTDPLVYGVSIEQSEDLAAKQLAFTQALQVATAPGTNSRVAVVAKDTTRELLVGAMRQIANIVRTRPGLTRSQLIDVCLRPPEQRRRRVNGPTTAPHVYVVSTNRRTITVRLSDPANSSRRAKPRDVTAAIVFTHVGEEYPQTALPWRPAGQFTRTTFTLDFNDPKIPSGATVWITAAWLGTRQQAGPLATPAYASVAGRAVFKLRVLNAA